MEGGTTTRETFVAMATAVLMALMLKHGNESYARGADHMPRELKFAAIDIGSNAVRLLLSRALATKMGTLLRRDSFIRMPLRLGEDVFTCGKISRKKAEQLSSTIAALSGSISLSSASLVGITWRSAVTWIVSSTASGLTRWSKATRNNGFSGCGSVEGV